MFAPCLIRLLVPIELALSIFPGTANISLPCSNPKSAVINEPLFSVASTTTIASDNALIILFLAGKLILFGGVPIIYSVIIRPLFFTIRSDNSLFSYGYILSNPFPITAIVFPLASTAPI